MSNFLETLKEGMEEAQKKFTSAQEKFTAAQTEYQASQQKLVACQTEYQSALQEFQAFQTLVSVQTRKEQPANGTSSATPATTGAVTARIVHQTGIALPGRNPVPQKVENAQPIIEQNNKSEGNKTEAVRMLLRSHTGGMTPSEIWNNLQSQLSNRVYLYSILKRLKDRGEVRDKRGKYYLNLKVEDDQNQVVQ